MQSTPPRTEQELLARVRALAGITLGELATAVALPIPMQQQHAKGWVGCLLEKSLGASAGSRPEPDFPFLGVELKTLPVVAGKPKETTYVCSIPLLTLYQQTWVTSTVYKKLARVLWVPIEADKQIPLAQRRIGHALLYSPTPEQWSCLQTDWQELTDMICMGRLADLSSQLGHYLHVRPKGADSKALCWAIGENGRRIQTLPRGFYLRTTFTQRLLTEHYSIN